jgi:L-ascorbate metabolism protein UlaG (beta-lactamase superfamily)
VIRYFLTAMVCGTLMGCSEPYYKGPASDHFQNGVFHSLEPFEDKSFLSVLKWRLTAKRAAWPDRIDVVQHVPQATVTGPELRATFVNHATVLLQTQGLNILTDPIWSMRAGPLSWLGPKRVHAPGVAWHHLPKIDVVLISHSHYDHLDLSTVKKLVARDNPLFVVPLGVDAIIRRHVRHARLEAMDWGAARPYSDVLMVHLVPAHHWSARTPWDRNRALWGGFVLDTPGGKIYYSGDTGFGSGTIFRSVYAKFGPMRLAIVPIGTYQPRWFMRESHIDPNEAVTIFKMLHATAALGVHFGTFQLSDEAIDDPVKDLQAALAGNKISGDAFRALKPGQDWTLP